MKWLPRTAFERCVKSINCKSPRAHLGPCQELRGGKLVFVDEDGQEIDVVATVLPRGSKRKQQAKTKAAVDADGNYWGN